MLTTRRRWSGRVVAERGEHGLLLEIDREDSMHKNRSGCAGYTCISSERDQSEMLMLKVIWGLGYGRSCSSFVLLHRLSHGWTLVMARLHHFGLMCGLLW